jgi:hypothetical protein
LSAQHRAPEWIVRLAAGVREEWPWLVAGQALIGLALVAGGVAGWLPAKGLSGFVGCFLLVHALLILLQQPQAEPFGARFQRRLHAAIASSGLGFYGVLCLSRFVQLELHDLMEAAAEFEFSRSQLGGIVRDWLIGFSVQSLMNSIEAMLWPIRMIAARGWVEAALLLSSLWCLYRFGAWLYPELHRQIEAEQAEGLTQDAARIPPPAER